MQLNIDNDVLLQKVQMASQKLTIFENVLRHDQKEGHGNKEMFLRDLGLLHASLSTFLREAKIINSHSDYLKVWANNLNMINLILDWNLASINDSLYDDTKQKLFDFMQSLRDVFTYILQSVKERN